MKVLDLRFCSNCKRERTTQDYYKDGRRLCKPCYGELRQIGTLVERSVNAAYDLRMKAELPAMERNLLRTAIVTCTADALPLMRSQHLRYYSRGSKAMGGSGVFRVAKDADGEMVCQFELRDFAPRPGSVIPPEPAPPPARKARRTRPRAELPDYWASGAAALAAATQEDECLTLLPASKGGYGLMHSKTHKVRYQCEGNEYKHPIHRVVFGVWHDLPYNDLVDLIVERTCDTPNCIYPPHLDIQSRSERLAEARRKRRS